MKKKFGSIMNNITRHIDSFRETVAEVQKKAKEKAKEEPKPEQHPEEEIVDIYTLMSYNELRNLAKQYGISTYRMKKEDLIVELKKHEEG
jgi:Sec-independent protein translocase protein TatA